MSADVPTQRDVASPARGHDSGYEVGEPRSSRAGLRAGSTAASLGVIYGYDMSSIAGALHYIADEFHLSTNQQGMVMTAAVIGEIAGAIGGGVLANALGRKTSMVLVTAAYAAFAVLGALSVSLPMLLMARLALGLTIGVSMAVVPVFVAESAPAKIRGSLLVADQLATVIGVIAGYSVAYLLALAHDWRGMLGLAAVPAVLVMLALLPVPDTARWYVLKGRIDQARHAFRWLEPQGDAEHELTAIARALDEESDGLVEMLRRPYLRATVFVIGLGFFAHISGIDGIVYYGPRLFAAMGFQGDRTLLVLALVQAVPLAAVAVSLLVVDRLGRRPVLLAGIALMIAGNAALIGAFITGSGGLAEFGLLGLLLFMVGFSFGFGGLLSVYAGESLPSRLRSMGSSAMLASNLLANGIVAATFLPMLHSFGGAGTFAVFGVVAAVAFVFVHRLAPETKGVRLEDIRGCWESGRRMQEPLMGAG